MSQTEIRILLLDDDYESMAPLKLYLETVHRFDVTLTAAATLPERLMQEQFDLICLDLMIHPISLDAGNQEVRNLHFPGVNWKKTGLIFLEQLRAGRFSPLAQHERPTTNGHVDEEKVMKGTSSQVPVIILSAVADRTGEESVLRQDQQTVYLEKPFDLEEMVALIEQLI